jgi:phosphatidylglycerophosphate synthase
LFLAATFFAAFVIYSGLYLLGRPPRVKAVKHNELLGPFMAGFLVWFISPLERLLVGRVSPNVVTALAMVMCGLTGIAAGTGHLAWAVWLYVAGGILDVLDGRIARVDGKQSRSGALFDSVSDRWGELFVFLGYAWYLRQTPWLLAAFGAFGASMMVSYTRARAEGLGLDLHGGLMQRAERILLVTGGTLIAAWYGGDAIVPIVGSVMLICTLGSAATAINRWVVAFRELSAREAKEAPDALHADEPSEPALPLPPLPAARASQSANVAITRA